MGALKIHDILVHNDKSLVKDLSSDVSYRRITQGVNMLARTAPVMVEVIVNEDDQDRLSSDSDSD